MFEPKWELRVSNDQYDIWDCRVSGQVISITHLKAHQQTNGHEHPNYELYTVLSGKSQLITGASSWQLTPDNGVHSVYSIVPNAFHQVVNHSDKPAEFLCLYKDTKCKK